MTFWLLLSAFAADAPFPERTPEMIEACLADAIVAKSVTKTRDSHKYVCGGDVALELWNFLEKADIESSEQTADKGVWLSRYFPLGGCFKRIRNEDGSNAEAGLSCTIWIPYRISKQP